MKTLYLSLSAGVAAEARDPATINLPLFPTPDRS